MKTLFVLILASSTATAGIYRPDGAWPDRDVSVCFAARGLRMTTLERQRDTHAWPARRKEQVRAWVEQEYTAARTGIHFTGWQDCADAPDADAVLFYSRGNPLITAFVGDTSGQASIGPYDHPESRLPVPVPHYPRARGYVWLNSSGFNRSTTLHEFGHLAGLHHEHHRREAQYDPACRLQETGFARPGAVTHGRYDYHSIMNYCFIFAPENRDAGLSPDDVATIRVLYP